MVLANPKHEAFAQARATGATADDAYVAAGFKANRSNAARLNANERILSRIEEILSAGAERAEIDVERVLREYGRIAFVDVRKLFTPGGNLLAIADLDDDTAAAVSSFEVVTRKVPGGEEAEVEHVAKVKFCSKNSALTDLGRYLKMFIDQTEVTIVDRASILAAARARAGLAADNG